MKPNIDVSLFPKNNSRFDLKPKVCADGCERKKDDGVYANFTYGMDQVDKKMLNFIAVEDKIDVMIDVNYYVKSTKDDFELEELKAS